MRKTTRESDVGISPWKNRVSPFPRPANLGRFEVFLFINFMCMYFFFIIFEMSEKKSEKGEKERKIMIPRDIKFCYVDLLMVKYEVVFRGRN